jgi:hypothetical protein
MKDALIIGAAAIAVYAVWRLSQPATPPAQTRVATSSGSSFLDSVGLGAENTIQARTGVPIAAIGEAAQRAPTWLKVAVFPVGVTAVAQGAITHPVDTAKSAYHAVGGAVSKVGSWLGL